MIKDMPQLTMLNENKSFGVWCAAHPVKWDCIYWPSGSLGRKWNFSVPVKIENRLGLGDKQGLSRAHKSMELLPLAPAGMGCGAAMEQWVLQIFLQLLKVWCGTGSWWFPQCSSPDSGEMGMLDWIFPLLMRCSWLCVAVPAL